MAEFERELDRMFADAPVFADADLFTRRVDERLGRGWTFRRVLIGGLGLLGGVIGGGQLLGSGLIGQLGAFTSQGNLMLSHSIQDLKPQEFMSQMGPLSGEVLWMSAGLAVVAVGFAVTRVIREF